VWEDSWLFASFSAFGNQRQTLRALMRRRTTFWTTSDALLSTRPSTVQAMEATMKITKPATVMRAFELAAARAAES
jgi:hypothetical protein